MILFALVGYCCCCCWIQTVPQQDGSHCCNQVVAGLSHVTIRKQVLSLIPDYLSRRAFCPFYFHLDPWNSLINCKRWFYCIYGERDLYPYIILYQIINHFGEGWNLYPCISTFTWCTCIKFIKASYFYPNVFGDIWYHFVISSSDFCEKIPTHQSTTTYFFGKLVSSTIRT